MNWDKKKIKKKIQNKRKRNNKGQVFADNFIKYSSKGNYYNNIKYAPDRCKEPGRWGPRWFFELLIPTTTCLIDYVKKLKSTMQ